MKLFFIQAAKEQVKKFEFIRDCISQKNNTEEVKNTMKEMLELIKDSNKIKVLSKEYGNHFDSSMIKWEMEYEIAIHILEKEIQSDKFTYVFELINYSFYYFLLPSDFKYTFFLMHGITVNMDSFNKELITESRSRKYTIYKSSQELYTTYAMHNSELYGELNETVRKALSYYSTEIIDLTPESENLFFFQIGNSKR